MTSTEQRPPFERFYDLNRLSEAGYEAAVEPDAAQRAKLAEWAELVSVERFEGLVSLKRLAPDRFAYSAHLEAAVTQSCTVTLEPVFSNIVINFSRILQLVPELRRGWEGSVELSPAAGDDEVPEEIDSTRYDLAAPLLEEFVLAIDPYPRAPGAAFAPPADADKPESPFAALEALKAKG